MSAPEFSRRTALDRIGNVPVAQSIEADADERAALAKRFGWLGIDALSAQATIVVRAGGIDAHGNLHADITQRCVATGDPVPEHIAQDFAIRFIAPDLAGGATEEIELSDNDLDLVEHDGLAVDLGEAVAQTLALAVNPFPRSPAATMRLKAAGVVQEGEEEGPLAAALKGLMKRD